MSKDTKKKVDKVNKDIRKALELLLNAQITLKEIE